MANKFFRKYLVSVATTEDEIYAVPPANTAVVSSLRVTNASANNATITVNVYPLGGATAHALLKDFVVIAGSTIDVFSGVPLIMEATDELHVEASEDDLVFYLSYMEMDRN